MWSVILAVTLSFLLMFFMTRLLMEIYLPTVIKNRRHREDRKKGQSFWDWLTYKRFRDVIPKREIAYLMYFINFALYFILVIVTVILGACDMIEPYRKVICSIQLPLIGLPLGARFSSLGGNRKN